MGFYCLQQLVGTQRVSREHAILDEADCEYEGLAALWHEGLEARLLPTASLRRLMRRAHETPLSCVPPRRGWCLPTSIYLSIYLSIYVGGPTRVSSRESCLGSAAPGFEPSVA